MTLVKLSLRNSAEEAFDIHKFLKVSWEVIYQLSCLSVISLYDAQNPPKVVVTLVLWGA